MKQMDEQSLQAFKQELAELDFPLKRVTCLGVVWIDRTGKNVNLEDVGEVISILQCCRVILWAKGTQWTKRFKRNYSYLNYINEVGGTSNSLDL